VTVYVDDWRQQARAGQVSARWSHPFARPDDDVAELHAFAAWLGLRRAWFQDRPWPRQHYDVAETRRQQPDRPRHPDQRGWHPPRRAAKNFKCQALDTRADRSNLE
jgi:hypothetical protein